MHDATQIIVAVAIAVFCLSYGHHAIALRTETEDIVATVEFIVANAIVEGCLKAQVLVVIGIMDAQRCIRVTGNETVIAGSREDAA